MPERVTVPGLRAMKREGRRIVCLTAYDATFAGLADESGADVVLVGDSLGFVILGERTTTRVDLAMMIHHTAAARAGVSRALLVSDLPIGTYGGSVDVAIAAGVALMRAGADAVKLEGDHPAAVAALVGIGVPVMGHVGYTPQSASLFGRPTRQGRDDAGEALLTVARRLEEAGAFGIVLEVVDPSAAERVTAGLEVPTIGIGSGGGCDGQVQVMHDVLGLGEFRPRHAWGPYRLRETVREAFAAYGDAVRRGDGF